MITSLLWFALAAIAEILGCFAFWSWLRGEASAWWLIGGLAALAAFAAILAKIDLPHAGRAYAAYGGIYIAASLTGHRVRVNASAFRGCWRGTLCPSLRFSA